MPPGVTIFDDTQRWPSPPRIPYRVLAANTAGDSAPSNSATATTLSASAVVTYASSLPWVSATAGWGSVQLNTSVAGNPITLRGVTYAQGLGTHAASQIIYDPERPIHQLHFRCGHTTTKRLARGGEKSISR